MSSDDEHANISCNVCGLQTWTIRFLGWMSKECVP